MFKTKSKILKKIGAGFISGLCAFSMLGSSVSGVITANAESVSTTENLAFPSADTVIAKAATLLGAPYGFGFKGYSGVYTQDSYSPLSVEYINQQGIDCSGLVYYTITQLGYSTSGFSWNNPNPVDTMHWLTVNDSCTVTYKGETSRIGERPMYLVSDHHDPIVDRDTYNRVQQELARRSSKRKVSENTTTEQGKYSSKYVLTELLICGKCGTPYRRTTWSIKCSCGKSGKKQIVWRCISRLEHGKKYCPDSPTIKEEQLHKAIIRAINNYYSCRNDIVRILKANIGSVLECQGQEEIQALEKRLKEIDCARNNLVGLIASGGCDEDKLDSEFAKLYSEEQSLSERLENLKSQYKTSAETQARLDKIIDMIEHERFELETFDNVLIRKLIECIKVLSKTEILVIFKGGYEVRAEIE